MSDQRPSLLSTTAHDVGSGFGNWWHGLRDAVHPPPPAPPPPGQPPPPPPTTGQQAVSTLRRVQTVVSSIASVTGLVQNALDTGFAELTSGIASLFPEFPAATLTMPYLGVPHIHSHPPSLIPPAPPVPLPSIGTILFGGHVRTLINGIPAARAGDLGLAPTCGGFAPYFEITTGSSNVFIGGMRAARMSDFCKVCTPAPEESPPVSSALSALAGVASAVQTGLQVAGIAAQAIGMAADITEAAVDDDPSAAAAAALNAAMSAAQMAADAVKMSIAAMMGTDPGMPNIGNVVMGHPNVLIGGFPMVNIPNPVDMFLNKLKSLKAKGGEEEEEISAGAKGRC